MAVDPLSTWKSTLAALPKVADNSWAQNFANWYAARIAGIEPSPSALVPTGFVFTFATALFASGLQTMGPVNTAVAGINALADKWLAAMQASTVIVAPGTYIAPAATPPTTFSVVQSTVIDAASMTAARTKLLELVTAPVVDDANDSEFPVKFREATLLLTMTVTGLDSTTPDNGGPKPLTAPAVPLV